MNMKKKSLLYWYIFLICFLEIIYRLFVWKELFCTQTIITLIFSIPFAFICYFLSKFGNKVFNIIISIILSITLTFLFMAQFIYYAFYKTILGSPMTVGMLEDVAMMIECNKFLVFGSAGVLDKEKCMGKVVVPTYSCRDEGTSYHYAKADSYIEIKNYK